MNTEDLIYEYIDKGHRLSTDTRQNIVDTIFFGIKGENFDGNKFVKEAVKNGAKVAVTEDPKNKGNNIVYVKNVLKTLQNLALRYRETFDIPIIAIGGSNGKTTSKELIRDILKKKYKVHATNGSFNNHIGVPLSIFSMDKKTKIGVFEIGANHPQEHSELLNILKPTHVVITNNGMDHLEGFGSPLGVRRANKEIYDWAKKNKAVAFVNKDHKDLLLDSTKTIRILYPDTRLKIIEGSPLTIHFQNKKYKTQLSGEFNLENIELGVAIGNYFKITTTSALLAIKKYKPTLRRSQFIIKKDINFIIDCYNANPTSMKLSIESFLKIPGKKGVVLGDMLELGKYTNKEHSKIVDLIKKSRIDHPVFVGKYFKKALGKNQFPWFPNSDEARRWFDGQKFEKVTFLLKGSRGLKIEKIIE